MKFIANEHITIQQTVLEKQKCLMVSIPLCRFDVDVASGDVMEFVCLD